MSTDNTAEMIEAEPLFIAAPPEEDEDDDAELDEDDDEEFKNPDDVADAYEEMRHRHREPWLNEEEEAERSPHQDEAPESLLDLACGGAS